MPTFGLDEPMKMNLRNMDRDTNLEGRTESACLGRKGAKSHIWVRRCSMRMEEPLQP